MSSRRQFPVLLSIRLSVSFLVAVASFEYAETLHWTYRMSPSHKAGGSVKKTIFLFWRLSGQLVSEATLFLLNVPFSEKRAKPG